MKRGRRWYQMPQENLGWFDEARLAFCDQTNPDYARDMRMISWRRPL